MYFNDFVQKLNVGIGESGNGRSPIKTIKKQYKITFRISEI